MLNKNTRDILQAVNNMTNSMIISYPVTTFTNDKKTILGNINFEDIDEGWNEFGIMDLNSFLNSLNILEDPTITQKDVFIKADDSNSSIEFVTSYPSILEDFTTNPDIISRTVAADSILEVEIDSDLFSKIKKGSSVFKSLLDLFIIKEGDKIYLKTGNKESYTRTQNSYTFYLDPSIDKGEDFEIVIPIENFLSLPAMKFIMMVKMNQQTGEKRLVFVNDIFEILLTAK